MKCICQSKRLYIFGMVFMLLNLLSANLMAEEQKLKPFILASMNAQGDLASLSQTTAGKLKAAGFEIVGEYSPYKNTHILAVSNAELREQAARSDYGAFGAIQRVTLSKGKQGTQIAYTNPVYMANVYQMKSDLNGIKNSLSKALGNIKEYGPDEGLSKEDLREYHYKILMPYFTDRHELADYGNQQEALARIEKVLATGAGGTKKIYRVDLPGKDESVIGVQMMGPESNDCSGDEYIMSRIDFKDIKSAGHLPYEIVVSKGRAYALYAEFRIAINFPDLSMVGSNSFASIMCAPSAIKTALTKAVGGKEEE